MSESPAGSLESESTNLPKSSSVNVNCPIEFIDIEVTHSPAGGQLLLSRLQGILEEVV